MWEMIQRFFNGFIDLILGGVNFLLGGLADLILNFLDLYGLSIEIPPDLFDILRELSIGIGYIIPVRALLPIPLFMLTFYTVKIIFSIYQLIAGTIIKRVKLKL